jgi:hypothetical protein
MATRSRMNHSRSHVRFQRSPSPRSLTSARRAIAANILQAMRQSDIFRTEEVEAAPPTPLPDLRAELKEIEDALAGLEQDDA